MHANILFEFWFWRILKFSKDVVFGCTDVFGPKPTFFELLKSDAIMKMLHECWALRLNLISHPEHTTHTHKFNQYYDDIIDAATSLHVAKFTKFD